MSGPQRVPEVRPTEPSEHRTSADTFYAALLMPRPDDELWARSAASWEQMRSFSAWDGGRCIGTASAFESATAVPGGTWLATSAVSRVGVLPTHRRRGVARALLSAVLRQARGSGHALASLRASETGIYGRYGFGMAGWTVDASLDARACLPLRTPARDDESGAFRLLRPEELPDVLAEVYDRVPAAPGGLRRPQWWWRRAVQDAQVPGGEAAHVVVHTGADGTDDGYARYSVAWSDEVCGTGTGTVHEVAAVTPGAELALWRYLLGVDLVSCWKVPQRPVDDLLRSACRDLRGYRVTAVQDEQWLRLVDVPAALAARSWADAEPVVLEVRDDLLEENSGTWRIAPSGAESCSAAADLVLDVGTLGALYLGGRPWRDLAVVGDVRGPGGAEPDPAAVAAADALFAVPRAPYCGTFF